MKSVHTHETISIIVKFDTKNLPLLVRENLDQFDIEYKKLYPITSDNKLSDPVHCFTGKAIMLDSFLSSSKLPLLTESGFEYSNTLY